METLLEGKTLSQKILDSLPARVANIKTRLGRAPNLTIINYFADSPSGIYVKRKVAACEKLGISVTMMAPTGGLDEFKKILSAAGSNQAIDALMIERPLPEGFEVPEMWDAIDPTKDVDALSSINMGRLFISKNPDIENIGFFTPCTALAVIKLLAWHKIPVKGRNIAVAGRSAVVGRPLAHMLTSQDATVTICHTRTKEISEIFKKSDIIITAAGKARWLKKEMLPEGATVIDVGTNIDENGKMCGDIDFDGVKDKVRAITPVPGGVGPVTMACLIEASVSAAEKKLAN